MAARLTARRQRWQDSPHAGAPSTARRRQYVFRSYFGVPSSITAPDGRPVNAVRGFIDSMAVVIHPAAAQPTGGLLGPGLAPHSSGST